MNEEPLFGAIGMDNLVALLQAAGMASIPHGSWRFPMNNEWSKAELRCNESEPGAWFKRIVQQASGKSDMKDDLVKSVIESCEIERGTALFALIKWEGGKIIYISMQVIVVLKVDLIEFCNGCHSESNYYRLDYSSEERGSLFDHPFPHVHTVPKGSPRFPWHFRQEVVPIFSFLEYIFINHHFNLWKKWLINEHNKKYNYISRQNMPPMENFFESFKESHAWARIVGGNELIQELKTAACDKLVELSQIALPIDRDLLAFNYWSD